MALEVKASKLSNGASIAYFMDSIKITKDTATKINKLVLYSSLRPDLNSEVELPGFDDYIADEILNPINGVFNITTKIDDQTVDCTEIVQGLIDACYNKGGGIIRFGSGKYFISSLDLKPGVSLQGNGIGSTILYRNIDVASKSNISDPYNDAFPFICIKSTDAAIRIKDMTLYGGVSLGTGETIDVQLAGVTSYNDIYKINGISINNTSATAVDLDANSANPYDIDRVTMKEYNQTSPMKNIILENLDIVGFSGSGIYIGDNNRNVIINNIHSSLNRYCGLINAGEYIVVDKSVFTGNGSHGIYNLGNYFKASNLLINYNGKYNHLDSYGLNAVGANGLYSNLNIVSNYCTGIYNSGNQNTYSNMIVDANGSRSTYDPNGALTNPRDVPQVFLTGDAIRFQGGIYNYKATNNIKMASKAITSDENLSNSKIDVTVSVLAGHQNSNIYSEETIDYSIVNNTSLVANNNVSSLSSGRYGSNVVTLLYI